MTTSQLSIGLFDSGIGGLTVMKEVAHHLPHENLIYLGDTAHIPYGEKSKDAIIQYTIENIKFLLKQKIKLLILACHTASCHALPIIQKELSIPVFGVIDAGLQEILSIGPKSNIAILGTTSTIESGIYQSLIRKSDMDIKIYPIACPLFVPLIEEEPLNDNAILSAAQKYLKELKDKTVDAAFLACTHYPLIRSTLQNILGPKVTLIESSKNVALQVSQWLKNHKLLNTQKSFPLYELYTTAPSKKFSQLARILFDTQAKNTPLLLKSNSIQAL